MFFFCRFLPEMVLCLVVSLQATAVQNIINTLNVKFRGPCPTAGSSFSVFQKGIPRLCHGYHHYHSVSIFLELDWNWIGLELDWNWIGSGLEVDWKWNWIGIGLELEWNWSGIGVELKKEKRVEDFISI